MSSCHLAAAWSDVRWKWSMYMQHETGIIRKHISKQANILRSQNTILHTSMAHIREKFHLRFHCDFIYSLIFYWPICYYSWENGWTGLRLSKGGELLTRPTFPMFRGDNESKWTSYWTWTSSFRFLPLTMENELTKSARSTVHVDGNNGIICTSWRTFSLIIADDRRALASLINQYWLNVADTARLYHTQVNFSGSLNLTSARPVDIYSYTGLEADVAT